MIKGILIDVNKGTSEVKELDGSLQDYYKAINCDCIDIRTRWIDNEEFSFVIDDNGLLIDEDKIIPSTVSRKYNEVEFVGNTFICRRNGPDLVSLKESDIKLINSHIIDIVDFADIKGNNKKLLIID